MQGMLYLFYNLNPTVPSHIFLEERPLLCTLQAPFSSLCLASKSLSLPAQHWLPKLVACATGHMSVLPRFARRMALRLAMPLHQVLALVVEGRGVVMSHWLCRCMYEELILSCNDAWSDGDGTLA